MTLNIKHVVSFSSEDPSFPAENLLKSENYYKWKCASGTERQATVVLQLEKVSKIHSIAIGNCGSAFIEVLVGRSSWSANDEFQVLIAASTFMSPSESKSGKELTRVRIFGNESIIKTVGQEKWDQVKIVCTQPYCQTDGYGLSFIRIHPPPDTNIQLSDSINNSKEIVMGSFRLKSSSDDENSLALTAGSFFQKRKNSESQDQISQKVSMAVAARTGLSSQKPLVFASSSTDNSSKTINISADRRNEVAASLLNSSTTDKSKSIFPKMIIESSKRNVMDIESAKRKSIEESERNQPTKKNKVDSNLELKTKVPKKKNKKNVPFNEILKGVVFVLSGYENPQRGKIRDLGISMGAQYSASWNNSCTHLICAFRKTPKFNEVKGKGKIVGKAWFTDCQQKKRRTNTKNFRIDGGGDSSFESSGDELFIENEAQMKNNKSSSENDTEDEINRVRCLSKPSTNDISSNHNSLKSTSAKTEDEDPYGASTESESDEKNAPKIESISDAVVPSLPDFFSGNCFFVYGDMDSKDRRYLKRCIIAYAGTVEEYMKESVNYVITNSDWDENFKQALAENSSLKFVRPKWIFKCHEKQKFLPCDPYLVLPL